MIDPSFPFGVQTCQLKFGSWVNGDEVDEVAVVTNNPDLPEGSFTNDVTLSRLSVVSHFNVWLIILL